MRNSSASPMISVLLITVLLLAACGGSTTSPPTATETMEEILAQATEVKLVKYDFITIYPEYLEHPEEIILAKVWFKENKMKIEQSFEGQVGTHLLDMDAETVYMWVSPGNEPRELSISLGEIAPFFSAMLMAVGVSLSNPTIIGSENLDGKDCLVVEYVSGGITSKVWLWKEKRFLVRWDLISPQGVITRELKNIDFGDIPDSVFELPQD